LHRLEHIGPLLPALARRAIRTFLVSEARLSDAYPDAPRAPVFVTLRTPDGNLRGCIGSLSAVEADVALETQRSAVLAATRDPRFERVRLEEIDGLAIHVSVLLPEQPIVDARELDPARYGVVVRDGFGRQGLLLPDVPGIDDARVQLEVARRKAGVPDGVAVVLSRFEVRKFPG
jgi:AmmeMemoRadiSam system protein A